MPSTEPSDPLPPDPLSGPVPTPRSEAVPPAGEFGQRPEPAELGTPLGRDAADDDAVTAAVGETPSVTGRSNGTPVLEHLRSEFRSMDTSSADRPAPWRLILAIALPLIAVAVVFILAPRIASSESSSAPLAISVVPQPGATSAGCAALDAALPADLDGHQRRTLAATEPGVAAWGDPPVVLRCGIDDPAELSCSSKLDLINGVSWLVLTESGSTTYVAVDRAARVALTLDDSVGIGSVQALSDILERAMPTRPVCTSGTVNPVEAP